MFLVETPKSHFLSDEYVGNDLALFTKSPEKIRYYSNESYFREGMSDAAEVLGCNLIKVLHRYSIIVFKPDAVVGRRIHRALDFLEGKGFVPVHALRKRFGRLSLREDWRYQLNQLTIDRMRLNTILAEMGDALFVVLRDDDPDRMVPASVRLQMMKGPSFPERQTPDHLRYVLGAWSRLLKFVHTPDEPADIVREIGIFLPSDQRRELWSTMLNSEHSDGSFVGEMVGRIYSETVSNELNLDASLDRIFFDLEERGAKCEAIGEFSRNLKQTVAECRHGRFLDWRGLERAMSDLNIAVDWDYIVLGAAFIHNSYEGEKALVSNDGVKGWLECNTGFLK